MSKLIVVREVVSMAVKMEHMQIPVKIQTIANSLPEIVFGQRSPYLK